MIPLGAAQWNYLFRPILWMRHRELIVYGIFGFYVLNKSKSYIDKHKTHSFVKSRVYTHDESDIGYRERHNKMDSAVTREKIIKFRDDVLRQ